MIIIDKNINDIVDFVSNHLDSIVFADDLVLVQLKDNSGFIICKSSTKTICTIMSNKEYNELINLVKYPLEISMIIMSEESIHNTMKHCLEGDIYD